VPIRDEDEDDDHIASTPTIASTGGLRGRTLGPAKTDPGAAYGETVGPDSQPGVAGDTPSLPGYQIAGLIGRGGMGEVVRGHDTDIGRDVAIKRLRGTQASPDAVARFLREAKIQARLEHPAIIPVHTIGKDAHGLPYFTMKRITGVSFAELMMKRQTPRQRMLRNLVDVCHAVDFAHTRNVVHRDIKPANIMVGDFGEVYVLDWGLAKVLDAPEDTELDVPAIGEGVSSIDGSTQVGAMLGTPGYMAPEQMENAHGVGTPADVYALGSILFEILAGEALHRKGQVLTSTLGGTDISPANRRPDAGVPPELDTLCVAALARDESKRPTARELGDRIEGFLDGDRDLEGRMRIAQLELEEAREALASGETSRRAEAMQAASRALALNPRSRDAADLITSLMLEPPKEQPEALRAQIADSEIAAQKRQAKTAMGSLSAVAVFLGLCAVSGVYNWLLLGAMVAYTIGLIGLAYTVSRRAMTVNGIFVVGMSNALLAAVMSRLFGSLLVVPSITCIMALSLMSYPQNINRAPRFILLLVASWMTPVALEWAGVLEPTWRIVDGAIISTSSLVKIGGTSTVALMIFAHVMAITVFVLFANKVAVARRDAQRQVEIQAWHLKQLLPAPRRTLPRAIQTPPAGVPVAS
jgi:eukaryotic-like serine/threonine-protein kinase